MIRKLSCIEVQKIKEGVSNPFVTISLCSLEKIIDKTNEIVDKANAFEKLIQDCKKSNAELYERFVSQFPNAIEPKPETPDYTEGNTDDINRAIEGLTQFCHSWCMDCEKTKALDKPIFRCKECNFQNALGYCAIKVFVNEHATSIEQRENLSCMSR